MACISAWIYQGLIRIGSLVKFFMCQFAFCNSSFLGFAVGVFDGPCYVPSLLFVILLEDLLVLVVSLQRLHYAFTADAGVTSVYLEALPHTPALYAARRVPKLHDVFFRDVHVAWSSFFTRLSGWRVVHVQWASSWDYFDWHVVVTSWSSALGTPGGASELVYQLDTPTVGIWQ